MEATSPKHIIIPDYSKKYIVIAYSQLQSLYCLSYILGIIFDIFSCDIHSYQEICYISLQIVSRTNQFQHIHCYHWFKSLWPLTRYCCSFLTSLCPSTLSSCSPCASSAHNSSVAPSSLRTIIWVLTVAARPSIIWP